MVLRQFVVRICLRGLWHRRLVCHGDMEMAHVHIGYKKMTRSLVLSHMISMRYMTLYECFEIDQLAFFRQLNCCETESAVLLGIMMKARS